MLHVFKTHPQGPTKYKHTLILHNLQPLIYGSSLVLSGSAGLEAQHVLQVTVGEQSLGVF